MKNRAIKWDPPKKSLAANQIGKINKTAKFILTVSSPLT